MSRRNIKENKDTKEEKRKGPNIEKKGFNASRLKLEERKIIEKLLKENKSCSYIASHLKRSKNGIVVEVRKGGYREKYDALERQKESDKIQVSRAQHLHKNVGFSPYVSMSERICNLEDQMGILFDIIKTMEVKK